MIVFRKKLFSFIDSAKNMVNNVVSKIQQNPRKKRNSGNSGSKQSTTDTGMNDLLNRNPQKPDMKETGRRWAENERKSSNSEPNYWGTRRIDSPSTRSNDSIRSKGGDRY